jgi:hypothetical protein
MRPRKRGSEDICTHCGARIGCLARQCRLSVNAYSTPPLCCGCCWVTLLRPMPLVNHVDSASMAALISLFFDMQRQLHGTITAISDGMLAWMLLTSCASFSSLVTDIRFSSGVQGDGRFSFEHIHTAFLMEEQRRTAEAESMTTQQAVSAALYHRGLHVNSQPSPSPSQSTPAADAQQAPWLQRLDCTHYGGTGHLPTDCYILIPEQAPPGWRPSLARARFAAEIISSQQAGLISRAAAGLDPHSDISVGLALVHTEWRAENGDTQPYSIWTDASAAIANDVAASRPAGRGGVVPAPAGDSSSSPSRCGSNGFIFVDGSDHDNGPFAAAQSAGHDDALWWAAIEPTDGKLPPTVQVDCIHERAYGIKDMGETELMLGNATSVVPEGMGETDLMTGATMHVSLHPPAFPVSILPFSSLLLRSPSIIMPSHLASHAEGADDDTPSTEAGKTLERQRAWEDKNRQAAAIIYSSIEPSRRNVIIDAMKGDARACWAAVADKDGKLSVNVVGCIGAQVHGVEYAEDPSMNDHIGIFPETQCYLIGTSMAIGDSTLLCLLLMSVPQSFDSLVTQLDHSSGLDGDGHFTMNTDGGWSDSVSFCQWPDGPDATPQSRSRRRHCQRIWGRSTSCWAPPCMSPSYSA